MMNVSIIPPEHIKDVWGKVEPLLQKAIDRQGFGRYEISDVLGALVSGQTTLWIYFGDDMNILSAWVLRMIKYPRKTSMLVELFGGEDLKGFEFVASDTIAAYARDCGCQMVECQGRLGWSRPGKRQGWEMIGGLYAKNI